MTLPMIAIMMTVMIAMMGAGIYFALNRVQQKKMHQRATIYLTGADGLRYPA